MNIIIVILNNNKIMIYKYVIEMVILNYMFIVICVIVIIRVINLNSVVIRISIKFFIIVNSGR